MAFVGGATVHIARGLGQSLAECASQTVPQDLALDHEPPFALRMRPRNQQFRAPKAQTVFPLDAAAAIYDALQVCLQQQLRSGFVVFEPLQPMFRERPEKVLEAFQRREKARQVLCRRRRWPVAGWRPPPMFDSERLGSGCLFREGLRETIHRSEVSKALGGSETGIRSIVRRSRDSGAQSDGSGGQTLAARGLTSTLTELGCGLAASSGGSTEVGFSRSARWLPCGHPMRGAQRPRAGKRPARLIGNSERVSRLPPRAPADSKPGAR